MKLNNNRFVISVQFNIGDDLPAYYDRETKDVVINVKNTINDFTIEERKDFKNYKDYVKKKLKRYIIHELTHWFDYNCWHSWSYKEGEPQEHLATFNELYLLDIIEFTDMIMKVIQDSKFIEINLNKKVKNED